MNFLPRNQRYIGEIASAVVGTGVVMGGPDILPDNRALAEASLPVSTTSFEGRLKLFNSMQHNSYRHRHGGDAKQLLVTGAWKICFSLRATNCTSTIIFWDYQPQRPCRPIRTTGTMPST